MQIIDAEFEVLEKKTEIDRKPMYLCINMVLIFLMGWLIGANI